MADTAPSFVTDAAQTGLPPKRRTGALALCTVLVVLLTSVLFSLAGPLVSAETREAQVLRTRSLGPVGMATAG